MRGKRDEACAWIFDTDLSKGERERVNGCVQPQTRSIEAGGGTGRHVREERICDMMRADYEWTC